jgi:hypothetical protein
VLDRRGCAAERENERAAKIESNQQRIDNDLLVDDQVTSLQQPSLRCYYDFRHQTLASGTYQSADVRRIAFGLGIFFSDVRRGCV